MSETRYEHCLKFLQTISAPGDIRELRVLLGREVVFTDRDGNERKSNILSGRFTDLQQMANAAITWSYDVDASEYDGVTGVYVLINPIREEEAKFIGAWSEGEMRLGSRSTRDQNVKHRAWLCIDCDPIRPTGVCSTDAEKETALAVSRNIIEYLDGLGWGQPILVDSGSGYHLWYKADSLLAFGDEWPKALKHIARLHSTKECKVDTTIKNPGRILRLPGTANRKGLKTTERLWRICKVLSYPDELVPVTFIMVRDLALREGPLRPKQNDADRSALVDDVEDRIYAFCEEYGIEVTDVLDKDGKQFFVLDQCPFVGRAHHGDQNKSAITLSSTSVGYSCFGGSCKDIGSTFKELREYLAKETGCRSSIQFYRESEKKAAERMEAWMRDEYKVRENKMRFDRWVMYDEATYNAYCEAESRKGTPDQMTDPAEFGFAYWPSFASHFREWAIRKESEYADNDFVRGEFVSRCHKIAERGGLQMAGLLMGEAELVFAARWRDRPLEPPAPERKYQLQREPHSPSDLELKLITGWSGDGGAHADRHG